MPPSHPLPSLSHEPATLLSLFSYISLDPLSVSSSPVLPTSSHFSLKPTVASCHLSVRATSSKLHRLFTSFNRFVRFHTYQIPLGFASISSGNGELPPTRDENNDISDRSDVILDDDDGACVSSTEADKPKKVLILMSDTGGGHRASAEAIKAAFEQEFGDKYRVNVTDLWTDHTPWPFNQLPRSYSFLVKHGTLWKMTYYASAPRVVHQPHFAATSTFIARLAVSSMV